MSEDQAQNEIDQLQMEKGELNQYTAKFENLARLVGYGLDDKLTLKKYIKGLPKGLQSNMINHEDQLGTWRECTDATICQQQKIPHVPDFFQSTSQFRKNPGQSSKTNSATMVSRVCQGPQCHGSYL